MYAGCPAQNITCLLDLLTPGTLVINAMGFDPPGIVYIGANVLCYYILYEALFGGK